MLISVLTCWCLSYVFTNFKTRSSHFLCFWMIQKTMLTVGTRPEAKLNYKHQTLNGTVWMIMQQDQYLNSWVVFLDATSLYAMLTEYDFYQHVASDVGVDHAFLPPENIPTQSNIDSISNWTKENLMQLNEKKCNYMIFSRSETKFSTRLNVNNIHMDRVSVKNCLVYGWIWTCLSTETVRKYVSRRTPDFQCWQS